MKSSKRMMGLALGLLAMNFSVGPNAQASEVSSAYLARLNRVCEADVMPIASSEGYGYDDACAAVAEKATGLLEGVAADESPDKNPWGDNNLDRAVARLGDFLKENKIGQSIDLEKIRSRIHEVDCAEIAVSNEQACLSMMRELTDAVYLGLEKDCAAQLRARASSGDLSMVLQARQVVSCVNEALLR